MSIEGGPEPFLEMLRYVARKDRNFLNDEEKVMFDQFMATLAEEDELELPLRKYGTMEVGL